MKKILIATTALVAFAGAANAAEPIKLTVGGYAEQWVGYADNDYSTAATERAQFDVQGDNEIHFKGSTKLDNGLTVAFTYEHKADQGVAGAQSNDAADETYITVSGGFGALIVGQQDNVGEIIHNSAPDVGIGLQDGDWDNWVAAPANWAAYDGTYAFADGDADKIIYVTPAFAGLQAGFSYTPDITAANQGNAAIAIRSDQNAIAGDLWVGGFAYANKFGNVSVKADLGAFQANVGGLKGVQGGLNVGFAGFSVGGSYLNKSTNDGFEAAGGEGDSWDIGAAYETGPYAVSLSYYTESYNNQSVTQEDEAQVLMLSGAYTMGPGVALKASLFQAEYDGVGTGEANDNDGWGLVTGLRLDF